MSDSFCVMCAWCSKLIRGTGREPSVSHGICLDCSEREFSLWIVRLKRKLRAAKRAEELAMVDIGGEG